MPSLLSRLSGPGGLTGLHAKNQDYHHLIGMKFCMSHYRQKTIPDAKFEFGSSSIFGDMTPRNSPLKTGTSHQIRTSSPGKWV